MSSRRSSRWIRSIAAAAGCGVAVSGCLLPNKGTPVFVDYSAAEVWSGKGVLTEVSPDERECRVVFRDSKLITRDKWIDCTHVHPRKR